MRYLIFSLLSLSLAVLIGCTQEGTPSTNSEAATTLNTINEHCPIMGGDVTAEGGTVEWNGETVGFCCDGCSEKWQALSEEEKKAALAKAEEAHESHDYES